MVITSGLVAMGFFGCVFVKILLTLIHRHICMRLISWCFHQFVGQTMEPLLVHFPATGFIELIGDREAKIRVRLNVLKPIKFCFCLLSNFKLGLAESFMEGAWTAEPCPKEFISLLIRAKKRRREKTSASSPLRCLIHQSCIPHWVNPCLQQFSSLWQRCFFSSSRMEKEENTEVQARRNAQAHYDLGNRLFQQFLDSSMTYSCAYFEDVEKAANTLAAADSDQTATIEALLFNAQMRKYDAILDALGPLTGDHHVLEIGFGWGAFALRAVQRHGCHWTGLTLSTEQLCLAQRRVEAAGFTARVNLKLLDYRSDIGIQQQQFDHVVAVEMIEAVGHQFLGQFFATCARRLKPGGRLCLQAILCPDEQYERYCNSSDFIRKHIFPGGHLPSLAAIRQALPDELKLVNVQRMDAHYSLTLDIWRSSWLRNRKRILGIGYSERFYRKWDMYFSLCSALFEHGSVHAAQILIEKCASG